MTQRVEGWDGAGTWLKDHGYLIHLPLLDKSFFNILKLFFLIFFSLTLAESIRRRGKWGKSSNIPPCKSSVLRSFLNLGFVIN